MDINRENYKSKLNCTDEQLDELIKIYHGFLAGGISADFDELVNGIGKVIVPKQIDIEWAHNVLAEIDSEDAP